MLAIILTIALAQPPEALPVERYQWHDRVVVVWKKGKAADALKAIEVSGLKLKERIEPLRIAICTGKLTDESLKALRSNPAIASVEPDNDVQPQLFPLELAPPPQDSEAARH